MHARQLLWFASRLAGVSALGCTAVLGDDYFLLEPGDDVGAGGAGGSGASGPGSGGGALPKPDLGTLVWEIENASDTPATISHDGVLVRVPETGDRWMVLSEPDDTMLSDQDIWVTRRGPNGNWTPERLTDGVDMQFAYASAVGFGSVVHAVFSGNQDAINDVFYVRSSGDLWLEPANLTAGTKPSSTDQHDYYPSIAVGPEGQLATAYLSSLVNLNDTTLRVLRFDDSGVPDEPEVDLAPGRCDNPAAVFDASGKLHVLATCSDGTSRVMHATDASGGWQSTPMPEPACSSPPCTWSSGLARASIALGPDGELHAAWSTSDDDASCTGGATSCDDIVYAKTQRGVFSQPAVVVVATSDVREAHPAIAVDAHGRVMLAFHRFDDETILLFSWSEDGVTFSPPTTVAPTGEGDRGFPATMLVDPDTQLPELALEATIAGTEPLNTEIFRAAAKEP